MKCYCRWLECYQGSLVGSGAICCYVGLLRWWERPGDQSTVFEVGYDLLPVLMAAETGRKYCQPAFFMLTLLQGRCRFGGRSHLLGGLNARSRLLFASIQNLPGPEDDCVEEIWGCPAF